MKNPNGGGPSGRPFLFSERHLARIRPNAEEARQAVLDAAERFVAAHRDAVVIVATGRVEVVRRGSRRPDAEGVSAYDAAILAALTDTPMSSRRLARAAGHNFNSYFRERLSRLMDAGLIHRARRGYSSPR